jgi:hypothetical protein
VPGKSFEAFVVGERMTHAVRRTVTETDNALLTTQTQNPQPVYLDSARPRRGGGRKGASDRDILGSQESGPSQRLPQERTISPALDAPHLCQAKQLPMGDE